MGDVFSTAESKPRYSRRVRLIVCLCMIGLLVLHVVIVLRDGLAGRLPKLGRQTGFLTIQESADAFYLLWGIHLATGLVALTLCLFVLFKHLWPKRPAPEDFDADGFMLPPWIRHPAVPATSYRWSVGLHASYRSQFDAWWDEQPSEIRLVVRDRYLEPDGWRGFWMSRAKKC